jgi:hypothetical protein
MMSGARAGLEWSDIQPYLMDTRKYRLASQVATGRGGRPIGARQRNQFLLDQWRDVIKVVDSRPAWSTADVLGFIEHVRDELERADLSANQVAVMEVVVTIAAQKGTSRPAVPVHVVQTATGIPKTTAHRTLMQLADAGHWLALAKRGDKHKANLYNLGPGLAETYAGASPPTSHAPPTSHPPTSHPQARPEEPDMTALIALTGEDAHGLHRFLSLPVDQRDRLLQLLEDEAAPASARKVERRLRVVGEAR